MIGELKFWGLEENYERHLEEMPVEPEAVMYGFSETMGRVLLGKLKHTEMVLH